MVGIHRSRAPVAQLDRASVYGTEGREFESLRARHRRSCTRGLFVCWGRPRSFASGVRVKPRVKIPYPRACGSRFTVVAALVDVEWTGCIPVLLPKLQG